MSRLPTVLNRTGLFTECENLRKSVNPTPILMAVPLQVLVGISSSGLNSPRAVGGNGGLGRGGSKHRSDDHGDGAGGQSLMDADLPSEDEEEDEDYNGEGSGRQAGRRRRDVSLLPEDADHDGLDKGERSGSDASGTNLGGAVLPLPRVEICPQVTQCMALLSRR